MGNRWEAIASGEIVVPANDSFGFEIVPTDDPQAGVTFRWKVPPELCNAKGNLQGGVLAAFADAVLGGACAAFMESDTYPALAEMKIQIMRPAPAGTTITGTGKVLKAGKRVLFVEAEVTGQDGKLIAKASGTELPAPA
ncbi:MAG: PaaI family thioesterase [Actinomycetota bacterium]